MTIGNIIKLKNNGFFYMFLSVVFFSIAHLLVKYINNVSFIQLVFFRALVTLSSSYFLLKIKKKSIKGNNYKKLFLRGVTGTAALIMFFYSIQNLPLATAITLQNLAPIFTILVSSYFFKESITRRQVVVFVGAFFGVLLIKGFNSEILWLPFLLGLLAPVFSGTAYAIIRSLKRTDSSLIIIFYFSLVSLIVITPFTILNWVTPSFEDFLLVLLMAFTTVFAQICMTEGLQRGKSAQVVIVNYLGVILASIYGLLIFKESLSLNTYLGIGLILICVYLTQFKVGKTK